jgi:6-phosphogluconolactonase
MTTSPHYYIGRNGALTPVPGSPFSTAPIPEFVAVDLLGRFVYVTSESTTNVSAYSIGPNGALAPVAGSPFTAGFVPSSMAFCPGGPG